MYRLLPELWTLLWEMTSYVFFFFFIKELPLKWVVLLMVMALWVFFSTRKAFLWMARHSSWSLLNATRPWINFPSAAVRPGDVRTFHSYFSFTRCSHSSGEVRCAWQWHFRKPALSTGQCKLMENSFTKLNLYVNALVYHFTLNFFFFKFQEGKVLWSFKILLAICLYEILITKT